MSVLSWLADKLILCPTNHPIDPQGKRRESIPTPDGQIEAWVGRYPGDTEQVKKTEMVVLKFPGTAGRAERAGVHPAEILQNQAEVWTVNPKGYGGSSGPASIRFFPNSATAAFEHLQSTFGNSPIVVVGNSLGCISALYLAATRNVSAILLRNPPPIHQLIRSRPRYSSWNLGMSGWIADQVPSELDCVQNAGRASARCLFVQSERDRVVPIQYQNLIIDAYAGRNRVFRISDADHHEPIGEEQQEEYFDSVRWLLNDDQ